MGLRTLVVSRRQNGRFDCRYAHWGVGVDPIAQSRPLGNDWPASAVLAELDAGYEQVLVRGPSSGRYCVVWLDPTLTDAEDIALARTDDPTALRDWWTTVKSRVIEAVTDGVDAGTARRGVLAALQRQADAVYLPDDASFLSDGG